jgi:hypothetical protein
MTGLPRALFLIAFAVVGLACASDNALAPASEAAEPRVFTTLTLSPAITRVDPGTPFALDVIARDQFGMRIAPDAVVWSTSDPAVASVSESGTVMALTSGSASISAAVTIGTLTMTTEMKTYVRRNGHADFVITWKTNGWYPYWDPGVAHVRTGGVVEWQAAIPPIYGWNGGVSTIHLYDADDRLLAVLDFNTGSAAWTFDAPGMFRYCSGCWDPAESGVVYVR